MTVQKPSIPKGTRDFPPGEMVRRNYIFDTVRSVFELYGYQPIETPAMENLSTLLGKYGEEGDRLLFRILNSGDYLKDIKEGQRDKGTESQDQQASVASGQLADSGIRHLASGIHDLASFTQQIAEKGLRYDLTVPLARFVVQHQHELSFPFKRYQIQPVWRADRPQKGRYREFSQCDVDVIGSNSLLNEVELVQIIDDVFCRLKVPVVINLNHRKILSGIAESIGAADKLTDITMAIDKLEKVGLEKVNAELASRGLSKTAITKLQPVLELQGKIKEKKQFLEELFSHSEVGKQGIEEICTVMKCLKELNIKNKFEFAVRLARGLNYYTGTIIEVMALHTDIGSLCGGGRYDDLTGVFGLPGFSGVGISFGADRIYDVMMNQELFPATLQSTTRVLFVNFGLEEERFCLKLISSIREAGIPAEIYPEAVKLKKQLDYANRKQIPFVVLAGKDEMAAGKVTLKNMETGEQETIPTINLTDQLR
ncbi:MAG: histidine--tRNA ligase [Bacteroidetes bacterium]|nr:histidine--tRNA ligase [Bacteroidota bacterium]